MKAAYTPQNARFCIVCCEETEVTQRISEEVAGWGLPDVRSLLISLSTERSHINPYRHNLPTPQADAVAQSEYAIFITPSAQPSSQIKVNPLDKACGHRRSSPASAEANGPSTLLTAIHNCHGQSPQSWWLQLPTTKVSAKRTQPISSQQSVAEALNQIVIFMRNYRTAAAPAAINSRTKSAAVREMAADKVS